jgi:hypothetical protein
MLWQTPYNHQCYLTGVAYDGQYAVPVIITRLNFGFFKMPAYLLDSQDQLFMQIILIYVVSNLVMNNIKIHFLNKKYLLFLSSQVWS